MGLSTEELWLVRKERQLTFSCQTWQKNVYFEQVRVKTDILYTWVYSDMFNWTKICFYVHPLQQPDLGGATSLSSTILTFRLQTLFNWWMPMFTWNRCRASLHQQLIVSSRRSRAGLAPLQHQPVNEVKVTKELSCWPGPLHRPPLRHIQHGLTQALKHLHRKTGQKSPCQFWG